MQFQESSSVTARIFGRKGELPTECLNATFFTIISCQKCQKPAVIEIEVRIVSDDVLCKLCFKPRLMLFRETPQFLAKGMVSKT
jgi:hypothetical protein